MDLMGFFLAFLALVLYSTNILVTKVAGGTLDLDLGVLVAAAANFVVAALLFGAQLFWSGSLPPLHAGGALLFLVSGVFSTYLGRWFFFATVARLGPARASAFQITNPLFTVFIAFLFLGERLRPFQLAAIAVAVTGLSLVSYVPGAWASARAPGPRSEEARGATFWRSVRRSGTMMLRSGALLALGSSSSYAVANVLRGAAIRHWNEPVLGGLIGAFAGMVAQAALMPNARSSIRSLPSARRTGLLLYALIGGITILAQISVIASMSRISVGVANLITMSTPVLVTPASYFVLKNQERLTARTLIGIGLTMVGILGVVLR